MFWLNLLFLKVYLEAQELGFVVKTVHVMLKDNWDYNVISKDFNVRDFYIEKPKKYSKNETNWYENPGLTIVSPVTNCR